MLKENEIVFEKLKELREHHSNFIKRINQILDEDKVAKFRMLKEFNEYDLLAIYPTKAFEKYCSEIEDEINKFQNIPLNEAKIISIFEIRKGILDIEGLSAKNLGTMMNMARNFYHDLYIDFQVSQVAKFDQIKLKQFFLED